MSDYALQLIQQSLVELGYPAISNELAKATSSKTPPALDWFKSELTAGNYPAIESFLASTPVGPLQLHECIDPSAAILTILYLVRRTYFFEQLISHTFGNNPELLLDYLRNQLLPLLDQLQARHLEDSEFNFSKGASLAKYFDSKVLALLNRSSESIPLLDIAVSKNPASKINSSPETYFLGYSLQEYDPHSIRRLLVEKLLAGVLSSRSGGKSFDIPPNALQTLIDQSIQYQQSQNVYYLPPRTKFDESEEVVGKSPKELSNYYKHKFFQNKLLHTIVCKAEIWVTKYSPSGRFLVAGDYEGKLTIYDVVNEYKVLKVLDPWSSEFPIIHPEFKRPNSFKPVINCSWEPREQYLVACYMDNQIKVWYVGELHNMIKKSPGEGFISGFQLTSYFVLGPDVKAYTCEFLPDVRSSNSGNYKPRFVIGSLDKVLKAFDIDGEELFDFYGNIDDEVISDVTMKQQDLSFNETSNSKKDLESKLVNSFQRIRDLAITPNGKVLITVGNDYRLQFFQIPQAFDETASTKRIASITLKADIVSCSVSASGKYLMVNCEPEEIQVWDISMLEDFDGTKLECAPILYRKLFGHHQNIQVVGSSFGYFVPDKGAEELVVSGSDHGCIYFWKLHTGQLMGRIESHSGVVGALDWNQFGKASSQNDYGKMWCSSANDNVLKIWSY